MTDPAEDIPAPPVESDAPWLDDENYVTEEVTADLVRPGWFCYLREARSFVRVAAVSKMRTRRGRVVFIDMADGHTVALDADGETVFVRRRFD